jgi:hypothetical protein
VPQSEAVPRKPLALAPLLAALIGLLIVPASVVGAAALGRVAASEAFVPQAPAADAMFTAWQAFVARLSGEQQQRLAFAFDGEERTDWAYVPRQRVGLPIGDVSEGGMAAVRSLLDTGLGPEGTERAFQIVSLEEVLFANSGGSANRNPGNYFLAAFGDPARQGAWGWRFEGHHLSVSFTIVDGRVVSGTPAFFGGNPAHVPGDSEVHPGLNPFSQEEDLGFLLLGSFDGAQRSRVIIDDAAPRDILTTNAAEATMGPPEGVALADMTDAQQQLLLELLAVYSARMNPDLAGHQLAKIREAGIERLHFAWAGGTAPGEGHYYRIQGPTFVVEFDNTQNNANHVHSVWRDFEDDFGRDPLRDHLAHDHGLTPVPGSATATGVLGDGARMGDDEREHRRAHELGKPHSHHDSR